MKGALIAAAVLLGSAQAEVKKLKLKKIPLSEQLVSSPLVVVACCDTEY